MTNIARIALAAVVLLTGTFLWAADPAEEPAPPLPGPAGQEKATPRNPLDLAPDEAPTHLIKVLRTSNKAQTNRYVPKVYEFKNVNPYNVHRFIRRVVEIEEGAWYTFAKPDKKSGLLVVVVPEYQIPYIDKLVETIDRAELTTSTGVKRNVHRLRHRSVLDPLFMATVRAYLTFTARVVEDPEINGFFVQDAPSGAALLEKELPAIDRPRDQVELDATIYEINVGDDGTAGLDFHAWKNGPGRNLFAAGAFYERGKTGRQDPGTSVFSDGGATFGLPGRRFEARGRNAAYFLDVPSAFFDFLAVREKARVLTSSRLTALNGETASLASAEDILFYEVETGDSPRAGARPAGASLDPLGDRDRKTEFLVVPEDRAIENKDLAVVGLDPLVVERIKQKDDFPDNRAVVGKTAPRRLGSVSTGVFLAFRPVVARELIHLFVDASVVSHVGYQDDGRPLLASREFTAEIEAKDGQELVLGGLIRERSVVVTRKVPILGSLPVLGFFFGGEITQVQRTAILLVVRPALNRTPSLSDRDRAVMEKASGKAPVPLGASGAGFDQRLMGGDPDAPGSSKIEVPISK